jgi:hypothetical protein
LRRARAADSQFEIIEPQRVCLGDLREDLLADLFADLLGRLMQRFPGSGLEVSLGFSWKFRLICLTCSSCRNNRAT